MAVPTATPLTRPSVDKIEDASFPKLNRVQQRSTRCAQLIETESIENRRLPLTPFVGVDP